MSWDLISLKLHVLFKASFEKAAIYRQCLAVTAFRAHKGHPSELKMRGTEQTGDFVDFVCVGNSMYVHKVLDQVFYSSIVLAATLIVAVVFIESIMGILMMIPRPSVMETLSTTFALIWPFVGAADQGQIEITHRQVGDRMVEWPIFKT